MIKKYILGFLVAVVSPIILTYASSMPSLSVTPSGDGVNVGVVVTGGDPNANVVLFSNSSANGNPQSVNLGTTDVVGNWRGTVNTLERLISGGSPVYVQVNGFQTPSITWPYTSGSPSSATNITFSNGSPVVIAGQTGTVTISGSSGSYFISSQSNAGVNASISGNVLSFSGSSSGTSNVVICSTTGNCSTVIATVNPSSSSVVSLNPSSLALNVGQTGSIVLSGGMSPYTVSSVSGNAVSATLSGNVLSVTGNTTGTATVNVCSSTGSCTPLTVTTNQGGMSAITPIVTQVQLPVGQTLKMVFSGGNGSYFLQSPALTPVMASVSGNTLTALGIAQGTSALSICSTGVSACAPINIMVSASSGGLTGTGGKFYFQNALTVGDTSNDVTELQTRLQGEGYYSGPITGYFGPLTQAAVQAYQTAVGLPSTGYVGPLTMASFNKDF